MTRRTLLQTISASIASLFGAAHTASADRAGTDPASGSDVPGFPYDYVKVSGVDAYPTWQRLRAQGTGWPVIIGGQDDFARVTEQFLLDAGHYSPAPGQSQQSPQSPQQIIAVAASITIPDTLERLWQEEYGEEDEAPSLPPIGVWPPASSGGQPGLTVDRDYKGKFLPWVYIVVLPTSDPTEAPAYLRWGGWNACPSPEVHVATLRFWRRRYGVEVVGMSGDVINLLATSRPQTREEALTLAKEQYFYCADIVDQGTETLAPLAAGLMESDWWFFWWD